MLIHFSSDAILISTWTEQVLVPFDDVQRAFPLVLHDLYMKYDPKIIIVINGPWSFTQLRVACISLNMLRNTIAPNVEFLDISKIDLYKSFMNTGDLPAKGVIFMGQRKKMRVIELSNEETSVVDEDSVKNDLWEREYFIDWMTWEHPVTSVLDHQKMIWEMIYDEWKIVFQYKWEETSIDPKSIWNIVSQLEPRYMMEPQIG